MEEICPVTAEMLVTWAILNGEKFIGLCVHKMVGGELDSGPILTKEFYEIDNNTTITDVWDWMNDRSQHLVIAALELLTLNPSYILETQSAILPSHLDVTPGVRRWPN